MDRYQCGCFSETFHDTFTNTDQIEHNNICGQHPSQESAKEGHDKKFKMEQVIGKAREMLMAQMDSDNVAHHLATRNVITVEDKNKVFKIKSKYMKAERLLKRVIESNNSSLHHLRMALIKADQKDLLKYISERNEQYVEFDDDDLTKSLEGRCMIPLQGDSYVVAKTYNDKILINIRNYRKVAEKKYPTKQGVSLTLSRWLKLKSQKDYINSIFQLVTDGESVDEELIHLGGGVYVTLNSKYPNVDLRHFWKPEDSDKPVPTKRGITLNKIKWNKLCDVMTIMTDFVPELNNAIVCEYTHYNEMELQKCSECHPFSDEDEEEVSQNQEGDFQIMKPIIMHDHESE